MINNIKKHKNILYIILSIITFIYIIYYFYLKNNNLKIEIFDNKIENSKNQGKQSNNVYLYWIGNE